MCLARRRVNFSPPISLNSELIIRSFDADLPIVCNDEDLDDAVPKPPSGVDPLTKMRCFVATIQLNQILAFALRTIVRPHLFPFYAFKS